MRSSRTAGFRFEGGSSRISGEAYVRSCERLGVQIPGSTRRRSREASPYPDSWPTRFRASTASGTPSTPSSGPRERFFPAPPLASSEDPVTCPEIALLCGGVAFTSHSSKAATRLLANHLPEPFTNLGLSFAGDIFSPVAFWVLIKHREIAVGAMGLSLFVFAWFSPPIFRSLRVKCIAIGALLVQYFSSQLKQSPADCVRCPAGRGVKCSINSFGSCAWNRSSSCSPPSAFSESAFIESRSAK